MFYVYIVECKDGTLYTGWTVDIADRLQKHNQGKGAKYTRSRYPVVLKYLEQAASKSEACQREYRIKQLSREQKNQLIEKGFG
ncbi:GIY-YIG nuclease family protein [Dehalobacter sp. DCM]|uniref:GIY-YIG nuclease family protein n=1 Tax=Dehalobacter sp. DCM TaxID=2907827 RepID=UPI0030821F4B|nr:GIY-YIG nuclease family protein [Dehalobacter sp. DCM]